MQNFLAVNDYRFRLRKKDDGSWTLYIAFFIGKNVVDWFKYKGIQSNEFSKVCDVIDYLQDTMEKNRNAANVKEVKRLSVMIEKVKKILN